MASRFSAGQARREATDVARVADGQSGVREQLAECVDLLDVWRWHGRAHERCAERLGDHLTPQAILYPASEVAIRYPDGRRIALWEGIGRAVLAVLSDREIAESVDLGEHPRVSAGIDDARRTGVTVSRGEVIVGVTAVGAAVTDAAGAPIGVVAIVAPKDAEPERHADAVRAAADELTRLLAQPMS